MTRHLTNKEFESLIESGSQAGSAELLQHLESCHQCRQEFDELSSVFRWPVSASSNQQSESLAHRVIKAIDDRKKRGALTRLALFFGSLAMALVFIVSLPYLWQFLPKGVQETLLGYLPSIEWSGLMEAMRNMASWQPSSPFYLLLGGIATLAFVMLADSVIISRLFRKPRSRAQAAKPIQEQPIQGSRT